MPSIVIAQAYRNKIAPAEADHALARLESAPVAGDPFPHAIVHDLLPTALFSALRDAFPDSPESLQSVQTRRGDASYSDKRFSLILPKPTDPASETLPAPIRTLQQLLTCDRMMLGLLEKFSDVVTPRLDEFEALIGCGYVPLETAIELIYDRSGFELVPHTDGPKKLITALLYLADTDDPPELGTRLYRPNSPDLVSDGRAAVPWSDVAEAGGAPYEPNLLLCFARSDRSLHGVKAAASERPRRLVQYSILVA